VYIAQEGSNGIVADPSRQSGDKDGLRAGFSQYLCSGAGRGAGRKHVVDEQYSLSSHAPRATHAKRIPLIHLPLGRRKLRLQPR
jgi:hypothetical protein